MKCLEVNEFSACEIRPSHWLWNFSWLIEENGGERKGGAYRKLRERPLITAIQMWKINKPTKKQNLFINCTFSILQLSTTCLTLDLGLPGWDSLPVLRLPRQLGGEKPCRRWWPAPQAWWIPENWWSTAAQSLSKQPKVKRNGADRWGGKGWGTGFRWALICFCNSLRFFLSVTSPHKEDWLSIVQVGGFSRDFSHHWSSIPRNILANITVCYFPLPTFRPHETIPPPPAADTLQ